MPFVAAGGLGSVRRMCGRHFVRILVVGSFASSSGNEGVSFFFFFFFFFFRVEVEGGIRERGGGNGQLRQRSSMASRHISRTGGRPRIR